MADHKAQSGGFHYSYVILGCAGLICAVIAGMTINSAGIFLKPVSQDLGGGYGKLGLYLTIMFFTMTFFLPVAGKLMEKYDVRILALLSVLLATGSYFAMSRFISVYQFYITGFTLGIADTFVLYLIGPILVSRWFKKKVGFYLGIVMSFSGVGAVLFNLLGGHFIATYGWRNAYVYFAFILLAVGSCATLPLRSRPSDKGLRALGDTGKVEQATPGEKVLEPGVPASKAVKSTAFILACLFTFFISIIAGGIGQYLSPIALDYGFATTVAATAVSFNAIGNMLGKPTLGAIADKSILVAIWTACGSGIVAMLILLNVEVLGNWSMFAGAIIFGFAVASCMPVSAMIVRNIFGTRDYSSIYTYNQTMVSIASGIGALLIGFVKDSTGSFASVMTLGILVYAVSGIIGSLALSQGKKMIWLGLNEKAKTV